MTDLKPCLYCGGDDVVCEGFTTFWTVCKSCRALGLIEDTKEEAIAAHNAAALRTMDKERE